MTHQTATFRSGEVEIFYRLFGEPGATPVAILHGQSFFSYDWIAPAGALATDRQVVAMDQRGFGESAWAGDYSVPTLAADVIALLDHLGWDRAVLAGHSMGGRVCTYAAARNPDRAAGLVLIDWSPELMPEGAKRVTETIAGTPESFPTVEAAMEWYGADPASTERRARFEAYLQPVDGGFRVKRDVHFRNQFRRVLETGERPKLGVDMWAELANVACPILTLRGARSDMFAPDMGARMIAAHGRMRVVEVDADHDVAGQDPQGFVAAVRGFLAETGL